MNSQQIAINNLLNDENKLIAIAQIAFESADTKKQLFIQTEDVQSLLESICSDLQIETPKDKHLKKCIEEAALDVDYGQFSFEVFLELVKQVLSDLFQKDKE